MVWLPSTSANERLCNFPTRRQTDQIRPYNTRVTTAAARVPSTWSMCSTRGARALPRADYSIQKPPDHRSLPTPRRLSQVAASFFGSWCLGIHLGPLLACSTYNHSSVAEEAVMKSRLTKKEDPDIAFGILEISIDLFGCQCAGGDERIRTADPLLAKQVLSRLSYIPWVRI
jgi:hypothetical protein